MLGVTIILIDRLPNFANTSDYRFTNRYQFWKTDISIRVSQFLIIFDIEPTIIVQLGPKLNTKLALHTTHHHPHNFWKDFRPGRKLRFDMWAYQRLRN